ncbi:MAG: hypothetical protein HY938_00065 [Nitrosomonadales bacterium]|nr:hypothetical protein [Nitrosomonadales bacterium]
MNRPHCSSQTGRTLVLGIALLLGSGSIALAAIVSDVSATKHNLSAAADGSATRTGTVPARTVKATGETQICVFCHTPHAATSGIAAPLWNRTLSTATYTIYDSASMDAYTIANPKPVNPGAGSKVCLSCHDGTLAIGMVGVLNFAKDVAINMSGTDFLGGMPGGSGILTGYTRNLGIDLGNDHPIAFTYDNILGGAGGTDGELRSPPVVVGATTVVGNRSPGVKPTYPLESNQMQCPTCHDPHLSDTVTTNPPLKFMRGNRLQQASPLGGNYVVADDIMCLACHDKAGTSWSNSAHANSLVADQAYLDPEAAVREFSNGTQVWQASCLGCHDTHTVQGSRHLLREGTDSVLSPKSGGNPAIEQTCFQCHSPLGTSILTPLTAVPDIKTDFTLNFRMPINNADQGVATEAHSIGGNFDDSVVTGDSNAHCNVATDRCGKDFVESQTRLGRITAGVDTAKRHAECTDCHNPHRVTKTRLFNDDATPPLTPAAAGTHKHAVSGAGDVAHSNIASGSLRGMTGVEPTYTSNEFGANPSGFTVKRGDAGIGVSTAVSSTWVTREYQVCFKCHSNYAYDTAVGPPTSVVTPPLSLGTYGGSTSNGTNGMNKYTDVAMESKAPASHKGAPASTSDSGAHTNFSGNNHLSWHPVTDNTGRTVAVRGNASPNLWRAPWNGSNVDGGTTHVAAVGNQTMYCSDCHGSGNALTDGSDPVNGENGKSWGPHGSNNAFLLKGPWNTATQVGVATDTLCFRCHDAGQYGDGAVPPAGGTLASGFGGAGNDAWGVPITNLHQRHAFYTTLATGGTPTVPPSMWNNLPVSWNTSYRCTMCHTGTAHGWKNKGFLVNLDDLGLELNATGGAIGGEVTLPTATPPSTTLTAGQAVPKGTKAAAAATPPPAAGYTNGPYYQGAYLRVTNFAAPGTWVKTDCTGGCH